MSLDSISRKIIVKINGLEANLKREIRSGLYKVGKKLVTTANIEILKKPRSGKVYFRTLRNGTRRRHISSLPKEPWANLTGKARKGMRFNVSGSDKLIFANTTDYVKYLELGTSKMTKRPAMKISINKNKKNIHNILNNAIQGVS